MASTTDTDTAHAAKIRAGVPEMAAYLQGVLGQKITALATGTSDPKAVGEWARAERTPRPEAERRLRETFYVVGLLMQSEAPRTVKAWLIGSHPQLDDRAPALVIAEDDPAKVIQAARAFLAGSW